MARINDIFSQALDANGAPLSGGKLYFYDSGTSTPKSTYSDEDLTTPNANPVILDAAGVPGDIFYSGSAKIVLKDADDVQLRVLDPVDACCASEGGGGGESTPYWTFVFPAKTATFDAVAGSFYFVDIDTAGADVTMTLPASPSQGDRVGYAATSFDINYNVIIDGGTKTILFGESGGAGTTVGAPMDLGYWGFSMIYNGTSWVLYESLNVIVDI